MNEEKRNLLFVCVIFRTYNKDLKKCHEVEEMKNEIREKLQYLYFKGAGHLHGFRKKPDKVYCVWRSNVDVMPDGLRGVKCTIRLKSPYDTDFVIPELENINDVVKVETSWFPSRHEYGAILRSDGSIIETWDI